jgi:hypothetical protein
MAGHPGYWLSQTRLNVTQNILSGIELFTLPEISDVDPNPRDPLEIMVYVHFFAGSYNLWVAAVDWEDGIFLGYSRNQAVGPTGCLERSSHEDLRGIRIPMTVDGQIVRLPLERDTHFLPRLLWDALRQDLDGRPGTGEG